MKILLADDDPIQTTILTKRLKEKGYKITSAADAIQASLEAMRHPPNGIILDIQMPGGTGMAVLRQLKIEPRTKAIPIIVLSGSADHETQALVKSLGAAQFLSKPVDLNELYEQLARLVGTPHAAAKTSAA